MRLVLLCLVIWAHCGFGARPAAATPDAVDTDLVSGPRVEIAGEVAELTGLPPILDLAEVGPHLTTGLTTTLALRLDDVSALVTIRYELWDEDFHVAVLDGVGTPGRQVRREVLDTFDDLAVWWRGLRVRLDLSEASVTDRERLEIDIVPFSAAEQNATQRWFAETEFEGTDSTEEPGADPRRSRTESIAPAADDPLTRTFRAMLATSIRRRAVHTLRFEMEAPRHGSDAEERR